MCLNYSDLGKLGINLWNLCRVNSTHFFLAGGYEPQDETDKFRPRHDVGPLDEAWIFNGGSRKRIAKMNQARQNFACSLAFEKIEKRRDKVYFKHKLS